MAKPLYAPSRLHTSRHNQIQEGWFPSRSPAHIENIYIRDTIAGKSNSMNVVGVRAFVALNFVGGIGLLLVILTALLSPNVKRLPTWYNFCASWVVSCIAYTLLTFGGQQATPIPSYFLCSIQAALIYAVPPLTSCTTLALLIQILQNFSSSIVTRPGYHSPTSFLFGPYVIFLIVFIGGILSETQNSSTVAKATRGTYCYSTNSTWQRVSFAFVGATSLLTVFVQTHLAFRLYRNSHIVTRCSPSFAMTLRGLLFSLIGVITVILAIVLTTTGTQSLTLDIILAMLPVLALVVFGSQQDLINSWFYWKTSSDQDSVADT